MQRRWRAFPGILVAALAVCTSAPAAQAISLYSITDLGAGLTASGINEAGQVVGSGGLWSGGSWQPLGFAARDINDRGQVVGENYIWSGGTATELSFDAAAISNAGQVVGTRSVAGFPHRQAVVWDAGSGARELEMPGFAYDINDQGQIVYSNGPAVRWSEREGHVPLGPEFAYGLNDHGWAVGENMGWPIVGGYGAVLYVPPGDPPLPFELPPGNGTSIISLYNEGDALFEAAGVEINNAGQIVGGSQRGAFTWFNGKMNLLDDLVAPGSGWTLAYASDLNESAQIVGTGTLNGEEHAYLLTPEFDGMATQYRDYELAVLLGETLAFEFWLDSTAEDGSGLTYNVMVRDAEGTLRLLGEAAASAGGDDWQSSLFAVPADLIGEEIDLLVRIGDYAAGSNPTLYLKGLAANTAPVPEPGTLLLLGSGLTGLLGWRRGQERKSVG